MQTERSRIPGRALSLALLGMLFAIGAALRIASLNERSFWLDEATSVRQASWSIAEMLAWNAQNVHPPLFHTLLHYWIVQFSSSEVSVRSFALAWGLLAIPLTYWVGAALFDRRVGLFATGFLAISPYFIWYSQEARMYTMLLVFGLLSTGALWKALRTRRVRWWALYSLAIGAGLMTQYFFVFLLAGHSLYYLTCELPAALEFARTTQTRHRWFDLVGLFRDAPTLGPWLLSLAGAAVPLGLWLPWVFQHPELLRGVSGAFNYGGEPPVFGLHFDSQALVIAEWLFGFHAESVMRSLVASWPLLVTAAFIIGGIARRASAPTRYLVISTLVASGCIASLGMWQPIVLEVRYFIAATVPLVILLGKGLAELRRPVLAAVATAMVLVAAVAWVDQSYNPDSVTKWDNRAAMGIVADGYRPGDVILLTPYFVSSIPEYYLPPDVYAAVVQMPRFDRSGRERNEPSRLAEDLDRQVGFANRVWIVATWQEMPQIAKDRANMAEWLESEGYRRVSDRPLRKIRVTLYEGERENDFFTGGAGR